MKKNNSKSPLTFEQKLKKYGVPLDDVLAELSPKDRREVAIISQYYSLLVDLEDSRKKLNFTQTELAEKSAVPRTTISKIESGNRNVTIDTLIKLAQGMGKTLKISFV
ncbi:MAG TPA: helix-turn-helix domain-containing protein [Patescibacteria group bacterium]|jgi:DNA-binding XRE family transcriptional regulator